MSISVDANLKIPSLKAKSSDEPNTRIDNRNLRLIKRIDVDAVPKPGDILQLSTRSGAPFDSTVTRVEWDEGKDRFVVSCTFARRSITPDEHERLRTDPDWVANHLA